jgi:hypothetical protein
MSLKFEDFIEEIGSALERAQPKEYQEQTIKRENRALLLEIPFSMQVIYRLTAIIYDKSPLNFSTEITVAVLAEAKPTVLLTIFPKSTSKVWEEVPDGESKPLQQVIQHILQAEQKSPERLEVLARITPEIDG